MRKRLKRILNQLLNEKLIAINLLLSLLLQIIQLLRSERIHIVLLHLLYNGIKTMHIPIQKLLIAVDLLNETCFGADRPASYEVVLLFNAFDDGAGLVVQTVELLLVHGRVRRVWCFKGSNFYYMRGYGNGSEEGQSEISSNI